MRLENQVVDEEQKLAKLFYQYNGEVIRYIIYTSNADSSLSLNKGDRFLGDFTVDTDKQSITVMEYEVEGYENPRLIADFSYQGINYQLKGIMNKEDFIGVIENLQYFSNSP